MKPIISTHAPRDSPIHDWSTGSVRYWVDIEVPPGVMQMSIPRHGDYLCAIAADSNHCARFQVLADRIVVYDGHTRFGTTYSAGYPCEYYQMSIRFPEPPTSRVLFRAEYVLLEDAPTLFD